MLISVAMTHQSSRIADLKDLTAYIKHTAREFKQREEEFTEYLKVSADDYSYWAKMPFWTADEAVALMLGIAPEAARTARLHRLTANYAIVRDYRKMRQLVQRAQQARLLPDTAGTTTPITYLKWCKHNGIDIPAELETHLAQITVSVAEQDNAQPKPLLTRACYALILSINAFSVL